MYEHFSQLYLDFGVDGPDGTEWRKKFCFGGATCVDIPSAGYPRGPSGMSVCTCFRGVGLKH